MPSRRQILVRAIAVPALLGAAARASAQDAALLKESDAEARAVDYHADAATATKSPGYQPGQTCANCGLWGGEPRDATGGCGLFFGKQVAAIGWCKAWEKKGG
ncbi:MAG: high-potential iron-sulfur protein [Pelomonas sp.]|nr:high-potential iron-sulfur protein [Roseateles sp.]